MFPLERIRSRSFIVHIEGKKVKILTPFATLVKFCGVLFRSVPKKAIGKCDYYSTCVNRQMSIEHPYK